MRHLCLLALASLLVACQSNSQPTAAGSTFGASRPTHGNGSIPPNWFRKPQPGMDKEDILLIFMKPYRVDTIRTDSADALCGPKGTEVERWAYQVRGRRHDGLPVNVLFKGDIVCAITNTN